MLQLHFFLVNALKSSLIIYSMSEQFQLFFPFCAISA